MADISLSQLIVELDAEEAVNSQFFLFFFSHRFPLVNISPHISQHIWILNFHPADKQLIVWMRWMNTHAQSSNMSLIYIYIHYFFPPPCSSLRWKVADFNQAAARAHCTGQSRSWAIDSVWVTVTKRHYCVKIKHLFSWECNGGLMSRWKGLVLR